jgi:hypothetical protein
MNDNELFNKIKSFQMLPNDTVTIDEVTDDNESLVIETLRRIERQHLDYRFKIERNGDRIVALLTLKRRRARRSKSK